MSTTAATENSQDVHGSFPVPFKKDRLQNHVLVLFIHQVRTVGWMTNAETAWPVLGKAPSGVHDLFNPELEAEDLASFAEVQNTVFAQLIERMYDYGYLGIQDESGEAMADESTYTWIAAILDDMRTSSVIHEWSKNGGDGAESAATCYEIAELANARRILEGEEGFFYFKDAVPEGDALTIRQMALLAAMEEMSIRAATNQKRANRLQTSRVDGRTVVATADAKAWLKAAGRYLPITRRWGEAALDLSKRRFSDVSELCAALVARYEALSLNEPSVTGLHKDLSDLRIRVRDNPFKPGRTIVEIDRLHVEDPVLLEKLAGVLQLPKDLVKLRAREARANEELTSVQRELRGLAKPT
ncbi:MAG: hypothetical protein ACXWIT_08195 [Burkholderiales bacterium]